MYKFLLSISIVVLLSSCSQSALRSKLSDADEVVIIFNDTDSTKGKTVGAAMPGAVNRMIDFIDTKEAKNVSVTFDGKILFNKGGKKIQEVRFAYKDPNYRNFFFKLDDKQYYTEMSNEAANFLTALASGKEIYW